MEGMPSRSISSTLFQQEDQHGITYRIPALLYIPPSHTFLAFAEKRSTSKDVDALYLVLRRGVMDGHSVQWGPLQPLMEATLPGHRTMNPCPVWEQNTGRVYLFFICVRDHVTELQQIRSGRNAARLCFICSQDAGCSWGEVKDLTEEVIGSEVKHWATFAVGPGHGIQLQSGRLIIPAYAYYFSRRFFCFPCSVKAHSLMFYSDDSGVTWHHGKLIGPQVTAECQVAEVVGRTGNFVLYCNARTPNGFRAESFSTDYGDCFQKATLNPQLYEPCCGCQGSVVSFQPLKMLHLQDPSGKDAPDTQKRPLLDSFLEREEGAGTPSRTWLLYSHPTSKKRRINLGVYYNRNPLEGTSWSRPWILHRGPCGYSDLAVVEKQGLFACLFECGQKHECEQIAFRLFSDQEVLSCEDCNSPSRS
ncbi:sialidase-3 [Alexandromys fortis]|uniref:sialidase-3 n=1 Tax=Alexandromys fortis TaxID=100897 RepID=UPI002153A563|nr:sialidase-3 [Microtus fortis]XP_050010515.1 sialidase-3 [Microtus fortis]XP_050010516.1 sialidase-3 [Microtus fortis]